MKCKIFYLEQVLPSGTRNFVQNHDAPNHSFHFTMNFSKILFSNESIVFERMLEKLKPMRFKHPFILKSCEFNLEEP